MKRLCLVAVFALVFSYGAGQVLAQYSSSNYKANEVYFGSGGDTGQASSSYKASASVGSLGVGQTSSTNYQAYSGFLTPNEPFLELGIDTSTVNLGTLDTGSTKTGTGQFHVRAYTDSGYTVQTISAGLSMTSGSASHTITNMAAAATPTVGQEQFGINLVANTSPAIGSNPAAQPAGYATGQAASGYNGTNNFKYVPNDVIAQTGTSGWGQTNYTISYIADIGPITPAGSYTMVHDLVAVTTY